MRFCYPDIASPVAALGALLLIMLILPFRAGLCDRKDWIPRRRNLITAGKSSAFLSPSIFNSYVLPILNLIYVEIFCLFAISRVFHRSIARLEGKCAHNA